MIKTRYNIPLTNGSYTMNDFFSDFRDFFETKQIFQRIFNLIRIGWSTMGVVQMAEMIRPTIKKNYVIVLSLMLNTFLLIHAEDRMDKSGTGYHLICCYMYFTISITIYNVFTSKVFKNLLVNFAKLFVKKRDKK